MPEGHRAYAEWTPERFQAWAERIGAETVREVTALLDGRAHPQQAFRSCLGILRLADRYSPERLEAACHHASLAIGAIRYKSVKHIPDDFLRDALTPAQTRDLADILDDRYGRQATLVAAQVPVEDWHARLGDPTLADAILDRLVHNAYRLQLNGESQRKTRASLAMSITSS